MNIYLFYLVKEQIYSGSKRASINLSNTFSYLYLRVDDLLKNDVKVNVLVLYPPGYLSLNRTKIDYFKHILEYILF